VIPPLLNSGQQTIPWIAGARELPEMSPPSRQSLSTTEALEFTRGSKTAKGVPLVANARGTRPYTTPKSEPPRAIKQVCTLHNTRTSSVPIFKQVSLRGYITHCRVLLHIRKISGNSMGCGSCLFLGIQAFTAHLCVGELGTPLG